MLGVGRCAGLLALDRGHPRHLERAVGRGHAAPLRAGRERPVGPRPRGRRSRRLRAGPAPRSASGAVSSLRRRRVVSRAGLRRRALADHPRGPARRRASVGGAPRLRGADRDASPPGHRRHVSRGGGEERRAPRRAGPARARGGDLSSRSPGPRRRRADRRDGDGRAAERRTGGSGRVYQRGQSSLRHRARAPPRLTDRRRVG